MSWSVFILLFFKQKTAYEMRISDWSSDVCSSDLDPAAEVPGLGVAHDLTRVADRLQIAGDEVVERRSFRAGDLDDAASRRGERHIGNEGSNVVGRNGLEQAWRKPDHGSIRDRKSTRLNSSH